MTSCCEFHNLPNGCNQGRACPEREQAPRNCEALGVCKVSAVLAVGAEPASIAPHVAAIMHCTQCHHFGVIHTRLVSNVPMCKKLVSELPHTLTYPVNATAPIAVLSLEGRPAWCPLDAPNP